MTIEDLEVIRKLDFFEPLDHGIVKNIARQCFDKDFAPGDFIIRQGEPGLGLYFISAGHVRVDVDDQGSRITVAELGPGDCVGELSIVDEKSRSASVVCVESTKCLLLTRDSFSHLMNKHPQIAIQMVKALAARLRAANARMVRTRAGSPEGAPSLTETSNGARPAAAEPASSPGGESSFPFVTPSQAIETYTATKGKIKNMLLDVFTPLYAARAMTRFSMAVIGCPVTVSPEKAVSATVGTVVNDVKVCFFPANVYQTFRIDAYGDGDVSVTVLRANGQGANEPVSHLRANIRRNQNWRLHVPPRSPIRMEANPMEATPGETIDTYSSR